MGALSRNPAASQGRAEAPLFHARCVDSSSATRDNRARFFPGPSNFRTPVSL